MMFQHLRLYASFASYYSVILPSFLSFNCILTDFLGMCHKFTFDTCKITFVSTMLNYIIFLADVSVLLNGFKFLQPNSLLLVVYYKLLYIYYYAWLNLEHLHKVIFQGNSQISNM